MNVWTVGFLNINVNWMNLIIELQKINVSSYCFYLFETWLIKHRLPYCTAEELCSGHFWFPRLSIRCPEIITNINSCFCKLLVLYQADFCYPCIVRSCLFRLFFCQLVAEEDVRETETVNTYIVIILLFKSSCLVSLLRKTILYDHKVTLRTESKAPSSEPEWSYHFSWKKWIYMGFIFSYTAYTEKSLQTRMYTQSCRGNLPATQ